MSVRPSTLRSPARERRVHVDVVIVPAIEREPGHAAKVKLVVSEAPPPA